MGKKKDEQTTLDDQGVDLDKAMQEGMDKFSGELEEAAASDDTPSSEAAGPAKDEKEKKPAATPAEGKTDEDIEPKPGEKKDENPEPRFESHEKAEEGYKNLQGEKTKTDQENARLRKEIADRTNAETTAANRKKLKQDVVEFSQKRNKEALDAIDALDAEDPEYQDQVAGILAAKDGDISLFSMEHGMALVPQAPAAGPGEDPPASDADTVDGLPDNATPEEAKTYMQKKVTDAGIDPTDRFFINASRLIPEKDDAGVPYTFDQQIDLVIKQTKDYRASQHEAFTTSQLNDADRIARENQDAGDIMTRTGADSPAPEDKGEPKPVSLGEAIDASMEERRL